MTESLLIEYKIEVGEEVVYTVRLTTCLHPVDVLGDGEVDLHGAIAQPLGELVAVVLIETRGHDEALHSREGGQVGWLDDGLTTLSRSEEEDFALELLGQILVDDLHAIGERPLGSAEGRDLLLTSDLPCGELEVDELRDRCGLTAFGTLYRSVVS